MTTLLDDCEDALRRARHATTEGEHIAYVHRAAACLTAWLRERAARDSLATALAQSLVAARIAARNDGRGR